MAGSAPASPNVLCGPTQCEGGGCYFTLTLYIENASVVYSPTDYSHNPPNGCWNWEILNPDSGYGTKCQYDNVSSSTAYDKPPSENGGITDDGGPHLIFDDTNSRNAKSVYQNDLQWCANYGASQYGNGRILGEYMEPNSWTPVAPSQGVSKYLAELYTGTTEVGDHSNDEPYWSAWLNTTYAGTIDLSADVPGGPDTNYTAAYNDVYKLCNATPNGGILSIWTAPNEPIANPNNPSDANSAEQAAIAAMNDCDP